MPDLFSRVRWGSPHVLDDLRQATAHLGLTEVLLGTWHDTEFSGDLEVLVERLRYAPDTAPHTAAALKTLGLLRIHNP